MTQRPQPASTLFPYTTLFRSERERPAAAEEAGHRHVAAVADHLERIEERRRADDVDHAVDAAGHAAAHLRGEVGTIDRSEEHTSELQSRRDLVCRLLLEKKKK